MPELTIINQGEKGEYFYIIAKGEVLVVVTDHKGK
jgi:CRP-like cAMP-binding protein